MVESENDTARLELFVSRPVSFSTSPPLASSLQSFETTLFLIALSRYPSALVSCSLALESAFKAILQMPPAREITFPALLREVRQKYRAVQNYDFDEFRETRNRIAHYGYSPADDPLSARLLLRLGIPLLQRCYREWFDVFVDWQEKHPQHQSMGKNSDRRILPLMMRKDVADSLRIALRTHRRAETVQISDFRYCFLPLIHALRWVLFEKHSTPYCSAAFDRLLDTGEFVDVEEQLLCKAEEEFGSNWVVFSCGACSSGDMLAQLDDAAARQGRVRVTRLRCALCGFQTTDRAPFLIESMIGDAVMGREAEILAATGIRGGELRISPENSWQRAE
jgi:hypothetical protein